MHRYCPLLVETWLLQLNVAPALILCQEIELQVFLNTITVAFKQRRLSWID